MHWKLRMGMKTYSEPQDNSPGNQQSVCADNRSEGIMKEDFGARHSALTVICITVEVVVARTLALDVVHDALAP